MIELLMRAALAFTFILACACQSPAGANGAALYYGFTRVDPDNERTIENSYVVVKDGRIAATGAGRLPGGAFAERRDVSGLYATPGLIDTHAHVTLGVVRIDSAEPALHADYSQEIADHNARLLLGYGVTTIRNPGGDTGVNVAYRDGAARGDIVGPEAFVAGAVIDRSPLPFYGLMDRVTEDRRIEDIVSDQAAAGVDAVKLYYSLTEDDVAKGVAAAHAYGKKAIGHLSVSWKKAADFGIDALVHAMPASAEDLEPSERDHYLRTVRPGGFAFFEWWEHADLDGPVMKELIRTLAARKTHVDLTLIAFHLAFWGDDAVREEYLSLSHPALVENWKAFFRFDIGWKADDYARAKAVWPKIEAFAKALYDAGVPLTLGTDMANPFVAPGASLVQEMELHERAGIPHWAILRMATSEPARILGLGGKTGRIAKGLDADIVFTEGDPSRDFGAFHKGRFVLTNGVLYDADALKSAATQGD